MDIRFTSSRPSTVGIEWELALVDRTTRDLAAHAPDVIAAVARSPQDGEVTTELLTNTVEVVSGVHDRVDSAIADLAGTVSSVADAAAVLDADVICAGTHPFAQWNTQEITPDSERYTTLIDRTRYWGRQLLIWGVHVHVGIDDRDKVLPTLNAMLAYVPHLQAFSASSPYWGGVDTGYASNRALLFQQLPTAGLPPQLTDWADYERMVADMTRTGVVENHSEFRWDLRPSPHWGTLENRVSDGMGTLDEVAAVTALIQCLVTECSDRLAAGATLPTMQPWFVHENKWRAARYGMEAEIIVDAHGNERPVTEHMTEVVTRLEPIAERLGCLEALHGLDRIADTGAGYQRQLRTAARADGDLRVVVADLVDELRQSLDAHARGRR